MKVMLTPRFILIFGLLACLAYVSSDMQARKIKTGYKIKAEKLSAKKSDSKSHTESCDTPFLVLTPDSVGFEENFIPKIKLSGFDKTVGSNFESLFVSNGLDSPLHEITLDITYLDMKGRQLHRRVVPIQCDIPPGQTRRLDFKTWDSQKSFYFHLSAPPRRQATPFSVSISITGLSTPR